MYQTSMFAVFTMHLTCPYNYVKHFFVFRVVVSAERTSDFVGSGYVTSWTELLDVSTGISEFKKKF